MDYDYDENGRCVVCKKRRTEKGHDPCIADLPGVAFACCGHGGIGYVCFENGQVIRGHFDETTPEKLKHWEQLMAIFPKE